MTDTPVCSTGLSSLPREGDTALVAALAELRQETPGAGCGGFVHGTQVQLPDHLPVWRHVHPASRELHPEPYSGEAVTIHNLESAGASFLVHHDDGTPHVRRGPALTLRPTSGDPETLLVAFLSDFDALG